MVTVGIQPLLFYHPRCSRKVWRIEKTYVLPGVPGWCLSGNMPCGTQREELRLGGGPVEWQLGGAPGCWLYEYSVLCLYSPSFWKTWNSKWLIRLEHCLARWPWISHCMTSKNMWEWLGRAVSSHYGLQSLLLKYTNIHSVPNNQTVKESWSVFKNTLCHIIHSVSGLKPVTFLP